MFKTVKLKSLLLFVTILGSMSVFSQGQDSVLSKQTETVSDVELGKFADVYVTLQIQNQEAQQEMLLVVENVGLPRDRFNAIQKSSMENEEVEATDEEIKMHASATAKIEELQPKFKEKATQGIESSGLTVERFEKLVSEIEKDKALQQRLRILVMEKQEN